VLAFQQQRFGSYVLTAHLGRGGMADVFRAQRTGVAGFERTVVVKRILPTFNNDPQFVQMFINEAKIAARLAHPNIAQVYELGEIDGEYFMVLEYVKGMDLLHVLRALAKRGVDSRALPPPVAAYIARETARALSHAHEHTLQDGSPHPIVHRDVSPQNIMLSYDGQVKLVDFGIAKAMFSVREETRTGALKGKVAYMAPEQVSGESPGPEADLFALGVVLYEMLIGRRLFKGQNDFETINRVKTMPIPPPSRVAGWVPHELDDVVMRALERERTQRYRRAALMVRDLDAYLQSARFSTEQMAEWMAETFPPETRVEVPDGQGVSPEAGGSRSRSSFGTPSGSLSGRSRGGAGSLSLVPADADADGGTVPGTARARGSASGVGAAAQPTSAKLVVLIAVGLLLAVAAGVGGALLVTSARAKRETAEAKASPPERSATDTTPTTSPTTSPTTAPTASPTPPVATPPSRPVAPTTTDAESRAVVAPPPHPVAKTTAPIAPSTAAGARKPAAKVAPGAAKGKSGKARIEAFDDDEAPPPKIQTFDD
jgi:serine/threonine protein kinase